MQHNNKSHVKRSDDRKGSTRKNIRFEDSLLERIEHDRDSYDQSFSEWVKTACLERLDDEKMSEFLADIVNR